jgi:hypothetical protein
MTLKMFIIIFNVSLIDFSNVMNLLHLDIINQMDGPLFFQLILESNLTHDTCRLTPLHTP